MGTAFQGPARRPTSRVKTVYVIRSVDRYGEESTTYGFVTAEEKAEDLTRRLNDVGHAYGDSFDYYPLDLVQDEYHPIFEPWLDWARKKAV